MNIAGYELADFLPFDLATLYRLVERYDAAHAVAVVLGALAGLCLLAAATRGGPAPRSAWLLLALGWGWTGLVYVREWLGQLLWIAPWLATACMVQAALLLLAARHAGRPPSGPARDPGVVARATGLVLLGWAMVLHPLAGALLGGRTAGGLEWFGSTPAPTAIATIGCLLLTPRPLVPLLALVPLGWLVLASGGALGLGQVDAAPGLVLAAMGLSVLAARGLGALPAGRRTSVQPSAGTGAVPSRGPARPGRSRPDARAGAKPRHR